MTPPPRSARSFAVHTETMNARRERRSKLEPHKRSGDRINRLDAYIGTPRPSKVMVWTPALTKQFLQRARGHRPYAQFHLIACRGLRRGESCGLRWSDLDLRGGTGFVFTTPTGQPVDSNDVTEQFEQLSMETGLPPIRLHDLRHGAATFLPPPPSSTTPTTTTRPATRPNLPAPPSPRCQDTPSPAATQTAALTPGRAKPTMLTVRTSAPTPGRPSVSHGSAAEIAAQRGDTRGLAGPVVREAASAFGLNPTRRPTRPRRLRRPRARGSVLWRDRAAAWTRRPYSAVAGYSLRWCHVGSRYSDDRDHVGYGSESVRLLVWLPVQSGTGSTGSSGSSRPS